MREQLDGAQPINQVSIRAELQAVTQRIVSDEANVTTQTQQIASLQMTVKEAEARSASQLGDVRATTYSNVIVQDRQIAELENAVVKAKQSVEQTSIRSPVDGVVKSVATKTIGGVVTPAERIVEIVPEGAVLQVEATIQNKDIGFVKPGQTVVVKVDTYSFQRYGYLHGKVRSISPDAVHDETRGPIYKTIIEIDTTKTSKDTALKITSGMSVTSEITTGKRRIIEFFLDPLMTHVDGSLEVR